MKTMSELLEQIDERMPYLDKLYRECKNEYARGAWVELYRLKSIILESQLILPGWKSGQKNEKMYTEGEIDSGRDKELREPI